MFDIRNVTHAAAAGLGAVLVSFALVTAAIGPISPAPISPASQTASVADRIVSV